MSDTLDDLKGERRRIRNQLAAVEAQREDLDRLIDELAGKLDKVNERIATTIALDQVVREPLRMKFEEEWLETLV